LYSLFLFNKLTSDLLQFHMHFHQLPLASTSTSALTSFHLLPLHFHAHFHLQSPLQSEMPKASPCYMWMHTPFGLTHPYHITHSKRTLYHLQYYIIQSLLSWISKVFVKTCYALIARRLSIDMPSYIIHPDTLMSPQLSGLLGSATIVNIAATLRHRKLGWLCGVVGIHRFWQSFHLSSQISCKAESL